MTLEARSLHNINKPLSVSQGVTPPSCLFSAPLKFSPNNFPPLVSTGPDVFIPSQDSMSTGCLFAVSGDQG